jgi:septum formation protein
MKKLDLSIQKKSIKELLGERKLILASSSPRRADILRREGIEFDIKLPPNIKEESATSDPVEHVLLLSKEKTQSVSQQVEEGIILGADTIVVLDGEIMGKPQNEEEAFLILRKLSGKTHRVYTGVTLLNKYNGRTITDYDCTEVKFNQLEDERIVAYVETGEPMDKAGAYGIQGMGNFLVDYIQGSLDNVIGLPTDKLKEMLIKVISHV